ncbi:MAG: recombinase family protein [Pirellulaceae bacterium]
MNKPQPKTRCAIYTRKSHEEGLDQEFNSLDAQRQAAEAYVKSQVHEGWTLLRQRYDDGGISGGTLDRPALNDLMEDIRDGKVDCVIVYKVDRLSRSLMDFARLIDLFDEHNVTFVSVTQQFNTTTSMGRLTLNILLSFAQFEREIIGERIRDKKLLTARQGKYIGGQPKLGLDIIDRKYVINTEEAKLVKRMFKMLLQLQSCRKVAEVLNAEGHRMKQYETKTGRTMGGDRWKGRNVYDVLTDRKYIGKIEHKGIAYDGEHPAVIDESLFNEVAEVLSSNRTYTHKHQAKRFALLRRMLHCGECGSLVQPAWTRNHGREYRYYTCSKRIKSGYGKCSLPSLPAGEIESVVVDQLRETLRNPAIIAQTFREVAASATKGVLTNPNGDLENLRTRRKQQIENAIRSLLALDDQRGEFLQSELGRSWRTEHHKQHNRRLETSTPPIYGEDICLDDVSQALQQLDPIWEMLVPDEQRRILELLVERIVVSKDQVSVHFRADGIEQITDELTPLTSQSNKRKRK